MPKRTYRTVLATAALIGIATGCAGPSARSVSDPRFAALTPSSDLIGTWRGSSSWVGAFFDTDDSDHTLRIAADGTFTQIVTPSVGTNNQAKPSTWSGTITVDGDRVTLQTSQGPAITLIRSGSNTLYGVAEDPIVAVPVMMKLDRDGLGS